MPMASKNTAIETSYPNVSFLFTYAMPMILDRANVPIQKPVNIAKMKLPYANSQEGKSSLVISEVVPQ